MTPEEARQLLADFLPAESEDDTKETYIWWTVQAEVMKGPHSTELAELHAKAMAGDATAKEQKDAMLAEIEADARQKLHVDGLPKSWRPQPN